jgi:hypothetical protein
MSEKLTARKILGTMESKNVGAIFTEYTETVRKRAESGIHNDKTTICIA